MTLGPPFLERGTTQFRASATRSKVFESTFGADDYLKPAAEFEWPMAPALDGNVADLRVFTNAKQSSAYTAHLMNGSETAFFVAFSPSFELALAYVWKASDFPWMGIWEENHSRMNPPWSGRTMTRGMEFGVSPMPETRDAMVQRGTTVRRSHVSAHRLGRIDRRGVLRRPAAGARDSGVDRVASFLIPQKT